MERFRFTAWTSAASDGMPQAFASCLSHAMRPGMSLHAAIEERAQGIDHFIEFHVVDVHRRSKSPTSYHTLNCLRDILLGKEALPRSEVGKISRFLFIGETESIDEWEIEDELLESRKKDLEFYIRALQNSGLAQYGRISASETSLNLNSYPSAEALLIQLTRAYVREGGRYTADAGILHLNLESDVKLLLQTARNKPGFDRLGCDDTQDNVPRVPNDAMLLDEINLLFQLGKRSDVIPKQRLLNLAKQPNVQNSTVPPVDVNTSYDLKVNLGESLSKWAGAYSPVELTKIPSVEEFLKRYKPADEVAGLTYKLKRYELLRDLSRVIGSGTLGYLRHRWEICEKVRGTEKESRYPRRQGVYIIDDELFQAIRSNSNSLVVDSVRRVLSLAGLCDGSVVAPVKVLLNFSDAVASLEGEPNLYMPSELIALKDGAVIDVRAQMGPENFMAILIDPDPTIDYVGPIQIQWIERYLRRRCGHSVSSSPAIDDNTRTWKPPIIVFSKTESGGNIQQALNIGAAAYVPKDREFYLLFDIRRAIATHWEFHRANTGAASQFRALSGLKRNVAEKLQYTQGPNYVYGGLQYEDNQFIPDAREELWLKQLPKSDLHCHIGTCIPFVAIEVLALNTIGYAFPVRLGQSCDLTERIARSVVLAEYLAHKFKDLPPIFCLAAAADSLAVGDGIEASAFGLGDKIVKCLKAPTDRHQDYEIVSLLVALIAAGCPSGCDHGNELSKTRVLSYLKGLGELASGSEVLPKIDIQDATIFEPFQALQHVLLRAKTHLVRIGCRWDGHYSDSEIHSVFKETDNVESFWKKVARRFDERTNLANIHITEQRCSALTWISSNSSDDTISLALTWLKKHSVVDKSASIDMRSERSSYEHRGIRLQEYVCAVGRGRSSKLNGVRPTGLQKYLWGADLLGAAHLQYPDNLLLAAFSLTFDNASDNIVYCEVRCETAGYTKAGMGALDATDLLRHGFNLASLVLAQPNEGGLPLVRTNILLAAKRHKDEHSVRQMISLMEGYLDNRPANADDQFSRMEFKQRFPRWWRPSNVVGFDISGDESKNPDWLKSALEPLAAHSSSITIHAGEAADARSIWKAVYELNATRIGHGLRLVEDSALLGYCVRQGICMEMCPNSNRYTNGFEAMSRDSLLRDVYPLRHYMQRGLEVAISTDNRYLHPAEFRTLTSEYVTAARMVGGLTRWEVLQIVKAGFKNAFLDKVEVKELVQAVEEWIYRIVSRGWF